MERISVILVLQDVEYRNAFIRAVSMEWTGFTFIVPDIRHDLKQYDAKLVIFDDDNNDTLLQQIMAEYASTDTKFVYMTENPNEESVFELPYSLYKYDCATSIASKLKYIIGRGSLLCNKKCNCATISVISDEGGIGTTTFSLALTGMLNTSDRKAVYIPLTPVNNCRNYGSIFDNRVDSKFIFSRFIYSCLIDKPLPIPSVLNSKNGISFIRCPTFNFHYCDFSLNVANTFAGMLSENGFNFVIYDIGNHFTTNSREIIDNSDFVIYYHSIRNPKGDFNLPFDCENLIKVITASYDDMERYGCSEMYVPRCRDGNFYGFNNEYGIEISKIAAVVGGFR